MAAALIRTQTVSQNCLGHVLHHSSEPLLIVATVCHCAVQATKFFDTLCFAETPAKGEVLWDNIVDEAVSLLSLRCFLVTLALTRLMVCRGVGFRAQQLYQFYQDTV